MNNDNLLITTKNNNAKNWNDKWNNKNVDLKSLKSYHSSWDEIMNKLKNDKRYSELENYLKQRIVDTNGELNIFPYPDLLYYALALTPLNDVKVIIIGQDPYFNFDKKTKQVQAMGLSFSVPVGVTIPSSLNNIYANLEKYKHIDKSPNHGNLEFWAYQGCFMINTALTVELNDKNCHANKWKWFTDEIIKYISNKLDKVVFVLWGAPALTKKALIDETKHKVVISSHPSGLSFNTPLKQYPAFMKLDCFGEVNKHLQSFKKKQIIWKLPDY
jgi:uracil-DNA glycosylase